MDGPSWVETSWGTGVHTRERAPRPLHQGRTQREGTCLQPESASPGTWSANRCPRTCSLGLRARKACLEPRGYRMGCRVGRGQERSPVRVSVRFSPSTSAMGSRVLGVSQALLPSPRRGLVRGPPPSCSLLDRWGSAGRQRRRSTSSLISDWRPWLHMSTSRLGVHICRCTSEPASHLGSRSRALPPVDTCSHSHEARLVPLPSPTWGASWPCA